MNPCGYCGRENDDQSSFCKECGTSLVVSNQAHPGQNGSDAPLRETQPLTARYATVILLVFLGAQFGSGVLIGATATSIIGTRHKNVADPNYMAHVARSVAGPAVFLAYLVGGAVMFLMSRSLEPEHVRDGSSVGAAWIFGGWKKVLQGMGLGLITGSCFCALASAISSSNYPKTLGPVTALSATPGLPQLFWLLIALVLSPFIEELLFRGVLYGGYRRSFGPWWAAILTTVIFSLLHITETIYFWPALLGVAALALTALWFRLRSSAIGPAIAVHFGYNAAIAILILYRTFA